MRTQTDNRITSQYTERDHRNEHAQGNNNNLLFSEIGPFIATPQIIVNDLGARSANIYGVIRYFCQMKNGKCTASQQTIADKAGYPKRTTIKYINLLKSEGYIKSKTIPGVGVEYTITNKLTSKRQEMYPLKSETPMQEMQTSQNNPCRSCKSPMQELQTKRNIKRLNNDSSNNKVKEENIKLRDDDQSPKNLKIFPDKMGAIKDQKQEYQLTKLGKEVIELFRNEVNSNTQITAEFCEMIENWEAQGVTLADYRQGLANWKKFGDSDTLRDATSLQTWTEKAHAHRVKNNRKLKDFDNPQIAEYKIVWESETNKPVKKLDQFAEVVEELQEAEVTPEIYRQAIREQRRSRYPVSQPKSVKYWAIGLVKEKNENKNVKRYRDPETGEWKEFELASSETHNKMFRFRDVNTGEWVEKRLA